MNNIEKSQRKAARTLISNAICGLDETYQVIETVIVLDEDGTYDAIPASYLTDCSYGGSRNVVARMVDINDVDPDGTITSPTEGGFNWDVWSANNSLILDELEDWAMIYWDWDYEIEGPWDS